MAARLYYDSANPAAFSNLSKVQAAVKHKAKGPGDINGWFESV